MNESAKKLLWHRGNLSFKLHAAQKLIDEKFSQRKGRLFVGNCSRQWGKSYWAVVKNIEKAIKTDSAQLRYGAAFQSDLVDFIIPAFDKIMFDAPRSVRGVYKQSGTSYHFPNGSRIKLVGIDKNPNGLRGNTLDQVTIDECGFVGNLDYVYKSVIVPSTLHRPDCDIIFVSTPPSTPAHPFVDYVQKAESEGGYAKFDIYTNPLITEDDVERMAFEMGGKQSTTFRREALCEFVTDSDLAIIPEWNDKYIQSIERDELYGYYHKYAGMDLGVKDLTAAIFGYYDFKKASLIIEDEITMNGPSMNTNILVGAIREKEKQLWGQGIEKELPKGTPFRRLADNNWPILIQDLSTLHNLQFIATTKDNLEAMINEVRLLMQAGRIIIHPRCEKLIGCLRYGVWDAKKKAFARSTVYGHFDHLAALIYLVRNLATGTNPIPVDHGFSNHTAWLGNVKDRQNISHNAQVISDALIRKGGPVNTFSRRKVR